MKVQKISVMSKNVERSQIFSGLRYPSFSLKNRLIRAAWFVVWGLLASWTPPQLHVWRCFLLRLFGAKIGKHVRVYGSCKIWYPPNLIMEDYSVLAWSTNCYNQGLITIKEYSVVSQYAQLVAGTHVIDDPSFKLITKPITIERFAWIASDAFVGPGVTVHEGAVLGACAVTFKNLEPWSVYTGNPATFLRMREAYHYTN